MAVKEIGKAMTKEDIRKFAEYILSLGNFIEVSMVPAE